MTDFEERRQRALAAAAGLGYASLAPDDPDAERIDTSAARAISAQLARFIGGIVLSSSPAGLRLAIVNPERAADASRLVHAATGVRVIETLLVPASQLQTVQHRIFGPPQPHRQVANGHAGRGKLPFVPHPAAAEPVILSTPPATGVSTVVFKVLVLSGIGFLIWALFLLQSFLWENGRVPESRLEHVISWMGYAWAVPLIPSLFALLGLVLYRKPRYPSRKLDPIETIVSFRIIARGENAFRLRSTIESVRSEMAALPLFPYLIEAVTDLPVDLGTSPALVHFVVPADYRTGRASRFKARALEYAVERSPLPDDGWIFHLDEESHLTPSLVVGIHNAVREEEKSGEHRIGQGAILYHRDLARRPFLTLADSIRTGDDLGRFYFQHRLGVTIFGLHGSFILVRSSVEREVGFDFGPEGSITEDSFWALEQMQMHRHCRWVDGYLAEQSPQTIVDFIKQRRRWFVGLTKVVTDAPVSLRYRIPLAISTAVWSASWIGILYLYINLVAGFRVPGWVQISGNISFATYIATYVIGLKLNLENLPRIGIPRRLFLYLAQVALIPVFALLEAAGVIYGLVRPETNFHVIRK